MNRVTAFLAAVLLLGNAYAAEKPMKLFILSGQSNCAGVGNGDLLPAEYATTDSETSIFTNAGWTEGQWVPLQPYPRKAAKFEIENRAFGPELVFGFEMKKAFPGHRIGIVKQAVGGTSVVAWDKRHDAAEWKDTMALAGHAEEGRRHRDPLYPVLLGTVKAALAATPGEVEIAGILWFQAERDTHSDETARQWAPRVARLADDLREDLGLAKDLPLLVMDSHYSIRWQDAPHSAAIAKALEVCALEGGEVTPERLKRAAGLEATSDEEFAAAFQAASGRDIKILNAVERVGSMKRAIRDLAARRPGTAVIAVQDLPTYEGTHFTTEGQVEIGRRCARAMLAADGS